MLGGEDLYIKLRDQIISAWLLKKSLGYYLLLAFLIISLWGIGLFLLSTFQSLLIKSLGLFLLVFATVQGGLWGHDLAHHQIFKSEKLYYLAGIFCWNLFLGISFGYWNHKHNGHHAHPNTIGEDGDIRFPVLWFSPALTKGINNFQKIILPYQKYYFFPLLIFPYLVQTQHTVSYLIRQKTRRAVLEGFFFLTHHVLIWYIFFSSFSFPWSLSFLFFYYSLLGIYMGIIFSTNHYGMPVLKRENNLDYIHEQISTTRNIAPGFFNDVLYGGLNYQIEHHLFPTLPRKNLSKARKLVKKFCEENAIQYHETNTLRAFKEILGQLGDVSYSITTTQVVSSL